MKFSKQFFQYGGVGIPSGDAGRLTSDGRYTAYSQYVDIFSE